MNVTQREITAEYLPANVRKIISVLRKAGHEAYVVGGCVRDMFLEREPGDWDITTSARPEEVKKIFRRTIDTGIQHGTVTVLLDSGAYEVTTYRSDGDYEDQRHPSSVEFVTNLKEDLLRRDFTINAMAYNPDEGLQDPYHGLDDLEKGLIRCVGDPDARFSEDALRMMRAVRFSAQLDFDIEENTAEAIKKHAPDLSRISVERVCAELVKLIVSDHPEYMLKAYDYGITKVVLPEFDALMETQQKNRHHIFNVGMHTVKVMTGVRPERIIRLSALLHDIGKPDARLPDENGEDHFKGHALIGEVKANRIMRRLRMDNDTIRRVCLLVRHHDDRFPAEKKNVRRMLGRLGPELFPYYIELRRADTAAQSDYLRKEKTENIDRIEELYFEIIDEEQCYSLDSLAITGRDIIKLGVRPGPIIGGLLRKALDLVIEVPEANTKETLLKFLQQDLHFKRKK